MKLLNCKYGSNKDPFGLFDEIKQVHSADDLEEGGVLMLWGGEDIGTKLYGETPNMYGDQAYPSERDRNEIELILQSVKRGIPIIGVCRGAQLLCVVDGGKLAQHIDGHGVSHKVTLQDEDGSVIYCNSSHHQMMLPRKEAQILATAAHTTGVDQYNNDVTYPYVTEVAYFPEMRALGIQPHPEWDNCPVAFKEYCTRKIKEYLL